MAQKLLALIDWPSIVTDDLTALPLAAQVAAEFGVLEDAKHYCEMAAARRGSITSRLAMSHDSRYDALLLEATALAYADEDRKRSIEAAVDAYETYKRIGFAWRAARMAILLYQMTRVEGWKSKATRHLSGFPEGPFHRLLERPRALTKRQEDVLRLVRLGFDDYQIAKELDISYKTVRIHLGRLFKSYGVKSRSALMAKAATAASA
jgi:DNA-binding NarL/FixJ family response regulator